MYVGICTQAHVRTLRVCKLYTVVNSVLCVLCSHLNKDHTRSEKSHQEMMTLVYHISQLENAVSSAKEKLAAVNKHLEVPDSLVRSMCGSSVCVCIYICMSLLRTPWNWGGVSCVLEPLY